MDLDNMRFDEDATVVNVGELLEFDEIAADGDDPEVERLIARVHAARLAGA